MGCVSLTDTSLELQKEGCAFLQQLCCDGETCLRAVAVGGLTTILNTLEKYPAHMATPVMKLVLQICQIIANENSLTVQSIGITGNIGRVFSIFEKTSFPDAQPYVHMCQMVNTSPTALMAVIALCSCVRVQAFCGWGLNMLLQVHTLALAGDNVRTVLVQVGAKKAVTRATEIKFGNDSSVTVPKFLCPPPFAHTAWRNTLEHLYAGEHFFTYMVMWQEWAEKALAALNPPAERVTAPAPPVNNNNAPAPPVNNNSACCVVQ